MFVIILYSFTFVFEIQRLTLHFNGIMRAFRPRPIICRYPEQYALPSMQASGWIMEDLLITNYGISSLLTTLKTAETIENKYIRAKLNP